MNTQRSTTQQSRTTRPEQPHSSETLSRLGAAVTPGSFADSRWTVLSENVRLIESVDAHEWDVASTILSDADRVFVIGSGRSGLAAAMFAMRLMHLGIETHVAGEVTAPALVGGDVLVAVSGSGTTPSVVEAARTARVVGAFTVTVTTARGNPLAVESDYALILPANEKRQIDASISEQYAGSLFEQSVLLCLDAMFQTIRRTRERSADDLWLRHANIG